MSVWRPSDEALTFRAAAIGSGHVCFRPGFINKNQAFQGHASLGCPPAIPLADNVAALLLASQKRLFLETETGSRKPTADRSMTQRHLAISPFLTNLNIGSIRLLIDDRLDR
jgi:hypothetical protein